MSVSNLLPSCPGPWRQIVSPLIVLTELGCLVKPTCLGHIMLSQGRLLESSGDYSGMRSPVSHFAPGTQSKTNRIYKVILVVRPSIIRNWAISP